MTENFRSDEFRLDERFAIEKDKRDSLASFRERFYIPPDTIYMDGNSLGLLSKDAENSINRILREWKTKAIDGWLDASPPWFYMAENIGKQTAPLVGAEPEEVVCTGTTTVNIHSLLSTFYQPDGKRKKILADDLNFPSDIYALQGQAKLKGLDPGNDIVLVPGRSGILDEDDIIDHMTGEIAVVFLPSVLYRSGQLLDIPRLTRAAHERGILIGFDCSHSAGAVPHRFSEWGVDFALWCSYKYMNGGPGSPGFLYVNRKHFDKEPLLCGWFGCDKEKQFLMELDFSYARSAGGWQISTPVLMGMAGVEGALNVMTEAGIQRIREKSLELTSYFIFLMDRMLPEHESGLRIGTPRRPERRSGHVSVESDDGERLWRINRVLKEKKIIPDFRPPGLIRFAPIALYNTLSEVRQTVLTLKEIIDAKSYQHVSMGKTAVT